MYFELVGSDRHQRIKMINITFNNDEGHEDHLDDLIGQLISNIERRIKNGQK